MGTSSQEDCGDVSQRAEESEVDSGRDESTPSKEEWISKETEPQDATRSSTPSEHESQTAPAPKGLQNTLQRWLGVFTWMPKRCHYDPENPPKFTLSLNFLYAISATFTVANLYYNQPILNKIAETFDVTFEKASSVATLMQSGYAAGLLFLCPIGDIVRRRPFMLGLIWITATVWLGLCLTDSFPVFQALSFICGATTVTPQLLLPLVGDIAPLKRKASSLSIVVSGLMLGMLVARLLSGVVANWTVWRNIYWVSFAAQYILLTVLFFVMPDYPSANPDGLSYPRALWTVVYLLFTEPVLVQACLIAFMISACFTSFWTTLTFLLASPPYLYPSVTIGLFAFIGIVAICGGPVYGRFIIDRFVPWYSSVIGLAFALIGITIGTFIGSFTVAGPVIQAIAIDVGIQTAQTANRAAIYTINAKARNRVNTAYMVSAFCGQLVGTAVGNKLYARGGWTWSGSASIGFICLGLIACIAKGPREPGWFGWRGSWAIRRDDLPPKTS